MNKGINVISFFDGLAGGMIALKRAGIKVNKYYAFEIDKYAIKIALKNNPEIIELGDINNWKFFDEIEVPDLIIAGSPCQGFSIAGQGLNFDDPRSKLFFVFVDALNYWKTRNPNLKFMLENVRMKAEWRDIITKYMGVEPIEINSALVSAQERKRLYWTNIEEVTQPEDKGILLKDVLEHPTSEYVKISKHGVYKKHQNKMSCLTGGAHSGGNHSDMDLIGIPKTCIEVGHATDINGHDFLKRIYSIYGKMPTLTTLSGGNQHRKIAIDDYVYRRLTEIEWERGQTLEDNFTKGVSSTQRFKMIGNGWTIDVIKHIFSFLPKEFYPV